MKIVIAPDSFKNCLNAKDVCLHLKNGFSQIFTTAEFKLIPLADGGEGSLNCLIEGTKGIYKHLQVFGPDQHPIMAQWGILGDTKTAMIEMASASGIQLIDINTSSILDRNTFGTGQLIKEALSGDCEEIIIAVGGSATNDGGLGMAAAMGFEFQDINGNQLAPIPKSLSSIHQIRRPKDLDKIRSKKIWIASDVENPLLGEMGASSIYGKQKGASKEEIIALDKGLNHFAELCTQEFNTKHANTPGSGAAGGLSYGLLTFMGAEIRKGFDLISQKLDLEQEIKEADIVISGEGKIDKQTQFGKLPYALGKLAKKHHKPVIAFCGAYEDKDCAPLYKYIDAIVPISNKPMTLQEAIEQAPELLELAAKMTARLIQVNTENNF